ncbi:kinase-like protein [Schizopora paradoxa]|uniref:non-specific serine/threonine protein kinase n=1 Tax=Schizopora paradoxa TaxID=27342 RepID=A0A0H2SI70_9AGAM|nr:kinase-like protein [Schizopora paradoxa]
MSAATSTSTNSGSSTPNKLLNDYQLGDCLGKGAFGQVYRALNWATGETCAVKEIQLSNIPKAELGEIMSEIDLLKNLNHPNIVKYKGFVKTKEYLYIILEFCENGSLHNICKRFGKFPENLVAVYISQVLDGLVYLHEQGVIHRDIKGANILTNKDGCVKLADFGVASTATSVAANKDAVVGSPYWMAPEVIEQSGATTASDIWSVGCVVIELLEGKPPYHFLDPMPALFRIVQDDCPPIPEGASPIVKDFLYHCFQKDVNLRISAKKLLRHPWMISARRQMGINVEPEKRDSTGSKETRRPVSNYNYDEAVQKVQEWNEALKSPSRPSKSAARAKNRSDDTDRLSPLPSPVNSSFSPSLPTSLSSQGNLSAWKGGMTKPGLVASGINGPLGLIEKSREPLPVIIQPPEEQTDNWDDDFEEGISLTKLHGVDKTTLDDEKHEVDDNAQTIRPPSMSGRLPASAPPSGNISSIIEDYSDLAAEEDENELESKVAGFKMKTGSRRGLFHPNDIKTIGLSSVSPGPRSAPLLEPQISKHARPPLTPLPGKQPTSSSSRSHSRSASLAGGSFGKAEGARIPSNPSEFEKFTEEPDEDYDDVFGKVNNTEYEQGPQTLQLNTRLSDKSWLGDEDFDEEDPFAEIDEGFSEEDLDANLQRDKHARLCSTVGQIIDELTPTTPDFQIREACDQLLGILVDVPEMQSQLVSAHGMLAILEVLEVKTSSRDVMAKLLQIVNLLVNTDTGFLESFCLIGGIPVMMEFTSKKFSSECRLEASHFISLLCHTSVLTLQMFIACRGLKVLVDLLDEDFVDQRDLVVHALNGVGNVFELQSPTPKNDFCRMFIKEGLLNPLSSALINVMAADPDTSAAMKAKIIQIILVFCQVSQSDVHVRNALGTRMVVRRIMRACELLEPEYLVQMLRAVKHLSMNASLLEVIQNANAIEILVRIMEEHSSGPHSTEICNHIFQTCYNLCRLNKTRQEEAAHAGIIPCLKRVLDTGSPLKQFALPILCDLASATKSCRTLLWQHDGLSLYLRLLGDPYFQVSALEAILSWLQDETARVDDVLCEEASLDAMVKCFVAAKANSFENLLEPFLKICRLSKGVTIGISKSQFFQRLIDRLGHSKPVVRLTLLRLLKAILDVHPNRSNLVEKFGIYDIVEKYSKQDNALLVREIAREIMPTLSPVLKPSSLSRMPKNGEAGAQPKLSLAVKRRPRRTASELGVSTAEIQPRLVTASTSRLQPSGSKGLNRGARQKLGDITWNGDAR